MPQSKGVDLNEMIKTIVIDHLSPVLSEEENDPVLALFAQWDEEDKNMTATEIAEENRSWEKLKTNINAERDRGGARRVF